MPRAASGLMSKKSEPASEMATAASPAAAAAWVRASQVNGGTTSRREKSLGMAVVRSEGTGSHEAGDVTLSSYGASGRRTGLRVVKWGSRPSNGAHARGAS